ncbi:MAG: hypothetical protein NC041_07185 [Bacteroides sp.]|nr:hypothetical protein [Prevotella sp.]MCM1407081.1 hypothetical protein [Treponema brennaborense]MCM1470233.1 hypothetical protein [Bacteroides sp.]
MKNIFIGNQRIIILQGIEKNITLSNEMAQRLLRVYGYTLPLESVNAVCIWLEQRGLVSIERLDGKLFTMKLTKHGQEVALGFAREDGVDLPVED